MSTTCSEAAAPRQARLASHRGPRSSGKCSTSGRGRIRSDALSSKGDGGLDLRSNQPSRRADGDCQVSCGASTKSP
eukprot:962477-Pyramimonas_sp.AAC.1